MRLIFLLTMLLSQTVYGAAKLQDADFKTVQQLINGGGSAAQLLNDSKIYVTANGINQQLSSAIQSGLIGGGGGTNLLSNGSFEASGVSGWSTFQTTLSNLVPSSAPATCSACTFAIGAQSTGALDGATSLQLTGASTTTPGQGFISQAFTISPAYQGQVMNVKGVFSVVSGLTALNLSGTSANSFALYIYDVTNAQWIQPTGVYALASNGGPFAPVTFQVPSNTGSLRFAVVNVNAVTAATVQLFDNLSVGPGNTSNGPAMTDFKPYVPTLNGFGTVANLNARWRQVGSKIEITGVFNAGTTTAVAAQIGLPNGYTTSSSTQAGYNLGSAFRGNTAATNAFALLGNPNSNLINIGLLSSGGTSPANSGLGNGLFATGDSVHFWASVEVNGLQSNVTQSSDYDGRNVNFAGTTLGNSAQNTNVTMAPLPGADKAGAWNGTQYVVQAAGDYFISGSVCSPQQPFGGRFIINGAIGSGAFNYVINTSTCSVGSMLQANMKVGDTIAIQGIPNGNTITITGGSLYVTRMPGSSPVIQAAQSVNATYGLTANQSVAAGAIIKFDTRATDNAAAYSPTTGFFSCPSAGQFRASIVAQTNGVGSLVFMRKVIGGVTSGAGYIAGLPSNSIGAGSISFRCNSVGDLYGMYLDVAATLTGANASGFVSQATFERTGN